MREDDVQVLMGRMVLCRMVSCSWGCAECRCGGVDEAVSCRVAETLEGNRVLEERSVALAVSWRRECNTARCCLSKTAGG